MKISRRIREEGPRFTLELAAADGGVEVLTAKHPGEAAAVVEAQMIVLNGESKRVMVVDEGAVLYTVVRGEDKAIRTYLGGVTA